METPIVECRECGARNRIGSHSPDLGPICGRCGTSLTERVQGDDRSRSRNADRLHHLPPLLLVILVGCVCYGIGVTPTLMRQHFSQLALQETRKTEAVRMQHEQDFAARKAALDNELAAVDVDELRRGAVEHYRREIERRRSYDKRFAVSMREKAKLRMRQLASDSTVSLRDVVRAVAREASPPASEIAVRESSRGLALHIDFDMSSMTSGESGTRTKHRTKSSLREEVVRLTSRVTNDIFEFCKDLDLSSIHVGCRHYVQATSEFGTSLDRNMVLYKIRIQRNRIPRVISNPFLDVYSTTKYFEVDEDNFADIEIGITSSRP